VHGSVDVVEKSVSDIDSLAGCGSYRFPTVCFLRRLIVDVVVSVKRIECTQHCPPSTQMFICLFKKPANISTSLLGVSFSTSLGSSLITYHWYLEERHELEKMADRSEVLFPR
jgi:hypothetical protein